MPWKVHSLFQQRLEFVLAALRNTQSIAQLCRQWKISQKTAFKWLHRYHQDGRRGLHDQSRRPKRSPRRTASCWVRALRLCRQKHPYWGAKKIYAALRRQHPRAHLPKVRTITRWLRRLELVPRRRRSARRGPQMPRPPLTAPQAPNQVWTADFKGWFRTLDGRRVDPLTVRDLFSRYILGIVLLEHCSRSVRQYFQGLFARYGLPKIIRVDHGPPFAGDGALDLSRLSAWWLRLGIQVEFTGRARPQDNAAHEQMHRVYKAELASPPAATPRAQQWRTTRWIVYYNHHRPHEALGQEVPASLYRKSRRSYRTGLSELKYPRWWPTRLVSPSGYIRWQGRVRVIGRAFGKERVGFKPVRKQMHEVYFGRHLIGLLADTDLGGMRAAQWTKTFHIPSKP